MRTERPRPAGASAQSRRLYWLRQMHATLIAEISSAEEFAAASQGWLTGAVAEVFPALQERLRTRPLVRVIPRSERDMHVPLGQSGQVLAELTTYRKHPAFNGREVQYSEAAWQRMLAALAEYPFAVRVSLYPLDDRGFQQDGGWGYVGVERDFHAPTWTSFTFTADAEDGGWPQSEETQHKWAEFVKGQAARIGACAGGMTDDVWPGEFALQLATENLRPDVSDSRQVLRGYTWVTIIAPELAVRLGRAEALRQSGAFYEVSPLPNGALWLRATPAINDFTGERVRRVFKALAPVLLTGTAEDRCDESFRIVEGVDAADFRPS